MTPTFHKITKDLGLGIADLISFPAFGFAYGHFFKTGSVATAKLGLIFGIWCAVIKTPIRLLSPAMDTNTRDKIEAVLLAATSIAHLIAMRRFQLIAKAGTLFFGTISALLTVGAIKMMHEAGPR
jgi:hypothetical protein